MTTMPTRFDRLGVGMLAWGPRELGADVEALIATLADPHPGPDEQLATDQERAVAAGVIDALPEESREVLLLYYREGQSSRQVAGLLGLQDAAVRKRLSRARERVREELLQRLGEFAKSTAPGAAFTTAVAIALTTAAPPAAAATALGVGALGGAKGLAKLGVGAAGFTAAGVLAGLWGSNGARRGGRCGGSLAATDVRCGVGNGPGANDELKVRTDRQRSRTSGPTGRRAGGPGGRRT